MHNLVITVVVILCLCGIVHGQENVSATDDQPK